MQTDENSADGLVPRVLCVRPHRHRDRLHLPDELEVGWVVNGHFLKFAACKNRTAFDSFCADLRAQVGDFYLRDECSNAKVSRDAD